MVWLGKDKNYTNLNEFLTAQGPILHILNTNELSEVWNWAKFFPFHRWHICWHNKILWLQKFTVNILNSSFVSIFPGPLTLKAMYDFAAPFSSYCILQNAHQNHPRIHIRILAGLHRFVFFLMVIYENLNFYYGIYLFSV